jgi:ribosomal protein S18 acetylase RimI-like enzyme
MKRRALDLNRDYGRLVEMHRLSWQVNFPGQLFSEIAFHSSLQAAPRENVFVYELDSELVGWLWLDTRRPGECHVRHIQVAQAHWGRGLGRQIMEDAIRTCRERGCGAITLNVTKSNERAVNLYTHLGFVVTEDRGARQGMRLALSEKAPQPRENGRTTGGR